jgi:glycosyltransferase involved in cell wall biosynthesis
MEPDLSIVVPVYRNAETLSRLVEELERTLLPLQRSFELLFVVDACPQHSAAVLARLACGRNHLRWVVLPRNWGQNWAVLVGLHWARGARLVVMDADLQDPPDAIPHLLAALGPGSAVVFAGRRGRYEDAKRLFTSRMFKISLSLLSGLRLPMDAGLFLAMTRPAADQLLALRQRDPYVVGLLSRTGARLSSIPISRAHRPAGSSTYNTRRRIGTAWKGLRCVWPWRVSGGTRSLPSLRERIRTMGATLCQGGQPSP